MTSSRALALLLPFLGTATATIVACEDGSNGGNNPPVDSGTFDSGPVTPIPTADAESDAPAPVKGVSVTVIDKAAAPKAGVKVVFQDATGTVISASDTDATGTAKLATVPAMVTVLTSTSATNATPVTFLGVADGDALKVVAIPEPAELPAIGKVSVTHASAVPTATSYSLQFNDRCSGTPGNPTVATVVDIFPECLLAQNSVLTTAYNGSTVIGYASAKNVTAPAGGNTVNVGPLAFTAPGTRTFAVTNPPDDSVSTDVTGLAIAGPATYSMQQSGTPATGFTFIAPVLMADAYETVLSVSKNISLTRAESRLFRREAATGDTAKALTASDASKLLPLLASAAIDTTTAARPVVTVTTQGAVATGAHSAIARFSWGDGNTSGQWTFVMPGDRLTFTAPALPTDAPALFTPKGLVQFENVTYVEGALLPSFDVAKKLPIPSDGSFDLLDVGVALPSDGVVEATSITRFDD